MYKLWLPTLTLSLNLPAKLVIMLANEGSFSSPNSIPSTLHYKPQGTVACSCCSHQPTPHAQCDQQLRFDSTKNTKALSTTHQ